MNTNKIDVSQCMYGIFWVMVAFTVAVFVLVGNHSDWRTGPTFFGGYVAGAVVGILTLRLLLYIPPLRKAFDAEQTGMEYGFSDADLLVPYFIVGVMAAILLGILFRNCPRFSDMPVRRLQARRDLALRHAATSWIGDVSVRGEAVVV